MGITVINHLGHHLNDIVSTVGSLPHFESTIMLYP